MKATKKQKKYPMDGPPLRIQQMMQRPRFYAAELKAWADSNKNMREETRAVCYLQ